MSKSLNRRELLTAVVVAAAGAATMNIAAMAQGTPPSATPAPPPDTTEEGIAMVSAAYAAAGFSLPPEQVAEVRKQLAGYPADFSKARAFGLDNGQAPTMDVTPVIPGPAPKRRPLLDSLGIHS